MQVILNYKSYYETFKVGVIDHLKTGLSQICRFYGIKVENSALACQQLLTPFRLLTEVYKKKKEVSSISPLLFSICKS